MKEDPTLATERKVLQVIRELEKKDLIPRSLTTRLKPLVSKTPKLYGLPKIHKNEVPLCPIVSCIDSLTLISSLAGETSFFIKNTQSFVDSIKNMRLQPKEVMVSFDIKSLFTSVPVQETFGVIHGKLLAD